ncbi:hypothetical protein IEQ34_016531 [Dendrobium chrysotoxum]|uniref:Uncharacterized protein n=1 Tax=Dendrobium chrysotoxum TaxID=161865 RepID=A0AAV7GGM1_DENCH|nr:hypothetical protein IEQ34_016531 [Dendrobium chrysotoxum]
MLLLLMGLRHWSSRNQKTGGKEIARKEDRELTSRLPSNFGTDIDLRPSEPHQITRDSSALDLAGQSRRQPPAPATNSASKPVDLDAEPPSADSASCHRALAKPARPASAPVRAPSSRRPPAYTRRRPDPPPPSPTPALGHQTRPTSQSTRTSRQPAFVVHLLRSDLPPTH